MYDGDEPTGRQEVLRRMKEDNTLNGEDNILNGEDCPSKPLDKP